MVQARKQQPAVERIEPEICEGAHEDGGAVSRVRDRVIASRTAEVLADTFKVLGDVTRVKILDALAKEEMCVCDLAAVVGLSESAVSHQLRLLRGMRLVRSRRAGRLVYYALDDLHIMGLFHQGLRHVEEDRRA